MWGLPDMGASFTAEEHELQSIKFFFFSMLNSTCKAAHQGTCGIFYVMLLRRNQKIALRRFTCCRRRQALTSTNQASRRYLFMFMVQTASLAAVLSAVYRPSSQQKRAYTWTVNLYRYILGDLRHPNECRSPTQPS